MPLLATSAVEGDSNHIFMTIVAAFPPESTVAGFGEVCRAPSGQMIREQCLCYRVQVVVVPQSALSFTVVDDVKVGTRLVPFVFWVQY
jgi:hypothetical protein